MLETMWALTFHAQLGTVLRANAQFMAKIEKLSASTTDEAVKKAADGLVWKLVLGKRSRVRTAGSQWPMSVVQNPPR